MQFVANKIKIIKGLSDIIGEVFFRIKIMKVTYFLGAGASYNAIPIVGELDRAFKTLHGLSLNVSSEIKKLKLHNQLSNFQAHMNTGATASKVFGTIDTYAKHLWLTNESDLKALKESLSFFFTVWQEIDKTHFNHNKIREKHFEDIDHRYLGLLSNYLEKKDQTIILNKDVKFISWNYDSQLERALSLFAAVNDTEQAIEKFSVYPYNYKHNTSPNIVHLNGIAGLYAEQNLGETKTYFDKVKKEKNILNVFKESLFTINSDKVSNGKYFTFAWEDDVISKGAIESAEKILNETEILVVIGYSFPTFNDQIDKRLMNILSKSDKYKMVYYQDPNASKELLISRFGIPEKKITIIKDTNQFILPLDSHNFKSFDTTYSFV